MGHLAIIVTKNKSRSFAALRMTRWRRLRMTRLIC